MTISSLSKVKSGPCSRQLSGLNAGSRQTLALARPKTVTRARPVSLEVNATASMSRPKPGTLGVDKERALNKITQDQLEVVKDLDHFAETELLKILKPIDKSWQPQDFLPDPSSPDFLDQVAELQKRTLHIPDDHLVCLVGDMITEEALPTYMTMLNTLDGTKDDTGASATAWAKWTRAWTAEENRHGDLMNKYLWLTGRVDMKSVEATIQALIGSGMDPKTDNNPYLGFVYTSFQERATKVSHGNTAKFAKEHGDSNLAEICSLIAADEARHEVAYQKIIDEVIKRDPDGAMLAFSDMMRKQIVMPAHLMDDGQHQANTGRSLFADFSAVAQNTGTYTAHDYADIMDHLIKRWDVADMNLESGEAAEAQEYVMKLPTRVRRLAERASSRKAKAKDAVASARFSWAFGRDVPLM